MCKILILLFFTGLIQCTSSHTTISGTINIFGYSAASTSFQKLSSYSLQKEVKTDLDLASTIASSKGNDGLENISVEENTLEATVKVFATGSVQNLSYSQVTSNSFVITWNPPEGDIVLTGYTIRILCVRIVDTCDIGNCSEVNEYIVANETSYTFEDALPYTEYQIFMQANSSEGLGPTEYLNLITEEDFPDPPANVSAEQIEDSSTVIVTWLPPKCPWGNIINYHITMFYIESGSDYSCPQPENSIVVLSVNASQTTVNISEVRPFSEYEIIIAAENGEGIGNASQEVRITTDEDFPDPPKNLTVTQSENTSTLLIEWEPPDCNRGILILYHVYVDYVESRSDPSCPSPEIPNFNESVSPTETELSYPDVQGFSVYEIRIAAETNKGIGPVRGMNFTTLEDVPDPPKNLTVVQIEGTSTVLFNWEPPDCSRGVLTGYHAYVDYVESKSVPSCLPPQITSYYQNTSVTETEATFPDCEAYSLYEIKIAAETSRGIGAMSGVNFTTFENVPDMPQNLSVDADFLVTWDYPECPNGVLEGYSLSIQFFGPVEEEVNCAAESNEIYYYNMNANETSYRFMESRPYSFYNISVSAVTDVGVRNYAWIDFQSQEAVLGPVGDLEVTPLNSTAANVTWNVPCPITDHVEMYLGRINGSREGYPVDIKSWEQNSSFLHTFLYDLKAEYEYTLTITAYGRVTLNGESQITTFKQPAGVPTLISNKTSRLLPDPRATDYPTQQARITIPADIFDPVNGDVLYYALIVATSSFGQNSTNGTLEFSLNANESQCEQNWPNTNYWGDVTINGVQLDEYQATPDCWNPFTESDLVYYTIGLDEPCGTQQFCNGPLTPHTEYTFKLRAYTSNGYQDTDVIIFHTDSVVAVGLALGLVSGFLIAGIVVFAAFMYRNGQISCSIAKIFNKEELIDVQPRPIPLKNFSKHCEELLDIPGRMNSEFQLLATLCVDVNDANTFTIAQLPDNKRKNRYINVLPYDANRVKLDVIDDDPSSDYINASFIKGYSKNVEYIATQGPKEDTAKDFWRMVYQHGVNVIVMVTQLEEQGKIKCYQYYPNVRETVKYSDIMVRCTTELHFPIYTSRTIILHKGSQKRSVTHLHFREWPDFGCPTSTDVMLQFCQTMRHQILLSSPGLTVVHCSAGVGRSGTLIAIDILLQHIRENKSVDIFGLVYNLRKQRTKMVQTEGQYAYIYKCIRDALEDPSYLKQEKSSTSSMEPIYETGPALNSPLYHPANMLRAKSTIFENEFEL